MSALVRGKFKCDTCGKLFENLQGLSGHQLVHRDTPPCEECGETFTTPSAARHRNKHHGVPLKAKTSRKAKAAVNGDWNADDILESVVGAMWPGGSVPSTAILPLFHWREATSDLLAAVQSPAQTQT